MDLTFNDQESLLRRTAADFLKSELPRERVLEIDTSPDGFSPELWAKLVELGWVGMGIAEAYGGGGSSLTDVGVFSEVLGEYACPSPFLSVTFAAQLLEAAGTAAQKDRWLSAIAGPGSVVTVAATEPEYGWRPEDVRMRAQRHGAEWVLDGAKLFVPDANIAAAMIVAARVGDAAEDVSLFLVPAGAPGLQVRKLKGWMSENMCEVGFRSVRVAAEDVLSDGGGGWAALERARDRATAVVAAYMAGGARRATEMAIQYSKTRVAFGVAIGTFQRIQDHVVIGLNDADAMRWTAFEALWKLNEGRADGPIAASTAKAVGSVGFVRACEEAHQVFAGVGTDVTAGLAHYTRRARTLQPYLGDAVFHRRRLARLLRLTEPGGQVFKEGDNALRG